MPLPLTEAQAQALIPVAGSLARGKKLADPRPWTNLGADELSVWGECAGSGKQPYLVASSLGEPASRCSCPSPDKPCKHAAALLLLAARQPDLFTAPLPDKLTAWRTARQQQQAHEARQDQPQDPAEIAAGQAAAAARLAKGVDARRQQRMVTGAAELAAALEDVVQQGLARFPAADFWAERAKRLVDNQLPGLAPAVRELTEQGGQPGRLLPRLGELYLLLRACQQLPTLPTELRQEVLQQAGVTFRRDDLLAAGTPVEDQWQVLDYVESLEQDARKIQLSTSRTTWLYGPGSGRYALLYAYAHGFERLPDQLPLNRYQAGGLVYYPGRHPLRAAVAHLEPAGPVPYDAAPVGVSIGQLLAGYAAAVGSAPWLAAYPVTLTGVLPAQLPDGQRALLDPVTGLAVPVRLGFTRIVHHYLSHNEHQDSWYQLLGDSAGQPCTVFGEWHGHYLRLLRSWPGSPAAPAGLPAREPTSPTGNGQAEPWPTLVQAATVGTATAALPELPGLPPAATPAQRLLLAAGTAALLQRAGYHPPTGAQPLLPDGSPEAWPVLGPTGTARLREFLTEFRYGNVAFDVVRHLHQRQRRVPASLLVPLLRAEAFHTGTQPGHLAVAGETGAWLLRQHPEWRKYLPPGHPPGLRGGPYHVSQRNRYHTLRDAQWQARGWELAAPMLAVQAGPDGAPQLLVKLPAKGPEEPWRALGIISEPTPKAEGGKWGGLLWQVLAQLPPSTWAEHLGRPLPELLPLMAAHEWGRPLLAACVLAAEAYNDREALQLLLVQYLAAPWAREKYPAARDLTGKLTQDERIDVARRHRPLPTRPPGLLPIVLYTISHSPRPWPTDLAAALLPELCELLRTVPADEYDPGQYLLAPLHEVITQHPTVPAELLPAYVQELTALAAEAPSQLALLRQMLLHLEFRQRLLASLDEPAA